MKEDVDITKFREAFHEAMKTGMAYKTPIIEDFRKEDITKFRGDFHEARKEDKLIAIGSNRCKLTFHPEHNDMGHFYSGYWDVPCYGYVDMEYWAELCELQSLNPESLAYEDRATLTRYLRKYGGTLAQFNAQHPNGKDYIRMVAVMGEQWITPLSYYQTKIKLPFLRGLCYCLNKLRYFKNRKEQKAWDEWLNKMYEDRQ